MKIEEYGIQQGDWKDYLVTLFGQTMHVRVSGVVLACAKDEKEIEREIRFQAMQKLKERARELPYLRKERMESHI